MRKKDAKGVTDSKEVNQPFDILESINTLAGGGTQTPPPEWCIPDVKILGMVAKNGAHRYSEACLIAAVDLYEGVAVCNDHTTAQAPGDLSLCDAPVRNPDDILGYFKNVRYVPGDGLRGNLHFTRRGDLTASVMVASRENPKLYGFSHHVPRIGFRSHMEGGVKVIDAITRVISVDLVTNPMTNNGLFAGVRPGDGQLSQGASMKFSDLLESVCNLPAEKRRVARIMADLKESMGDGSADMADPAVEVGNEATKPEDKIKAGFQSMMNDIVEGYMSDGNDAQLISRIKAAAKACGLMLKGDEPKAAEAAETPDKKEGASTEPEKKGDGDDKKEDAGEGDTKPDDKKESVTVDKPELLGAGGAADLMESVGVAITPKLLKLISVQTKENATALLESVQAEKKRADDLEKRLGVLRPEDKTRSTARAGGDLLASAGKDGGDGSGLKGGEYKPQLLKPAAVNARQGGSLVASVN